MSRYPRVAPALLMAGMMLMAKVAFADDITVNITGMIVIPPCTVNNGNTIDVDFGNISVTDVANNQNIRTQNVPVNCAYYQGIPYVKVTGSQLSGAATNILATNISQFGIALYQGSGTTQPMALGNGTPDRNGGYVGSVVQSGLSGVNQANGQFTFTAVPYLLGTAFPAAGAFSASANMSIIYQ